MVLRASVVLLVWVSVACGGAQSGTETTEQLNTASLKDGENLLEKGEFEKAAEFFNKIVAQEPGNADCHYYLALAFRNLENLEGAEEHYRLAIGYDAELAAAHNNLGLLLLEKGDLVHAETELNTYLKLKPEDASANFNYALVLDAMNKTDEARKHYEKSAQINPDDPSVWLALGDIDRQNGDIEAALKTYKKGKETSPESPELTLKEGQTLLDLKRLDEAVTVLTGLASFAKCPPEIMATAGILLAKYDEDEKAVLLYLAAISKDESYATAHLLAANALARKGKFAEAAKHYEAFLKISPDAKEAPTVRKRLEVCKDKTI